MSKKRSANQTVASKSEVKFSVNVLEELLEPVDKQVGVIGHLSLALLCQ